MLSGKETISFETFQGPRHFVILVALETALAERSWNWFPISPLASGFRAKC